MAKREVKSGAARGSDRAKKKPTRAKAPAKAVSPQAGKSKPQKAVRSAEAATKPASKKQPGKVVKKAARKSPVKSVKSGALPAGGAGKKTAIHLVQVAGWNVVDVTDGIAVHDSQFSNVHYLNHTAAALYLLCKEAISLDVVSTIIREEFGLDRSPESEVMNTIEEMVRIGLLKKVNKKR